MRKTIITLFIIYFFQIFITSCFRCDCPSVKTYERTYDGIELKSYDRTGTVNPESSEPVHKNSFGFWIGFNIQLNQITFHNPIFHLNSFGLGLANATSCGCPSDEFINIDPIHSIIITVTDAETQETIDVTGNFFVNAYSPQELSISQFIENEIEFYHDIQLDMKEPDVIPNSSIFKVKVILESGLELNEQMQVIEFE